MEDGNWLGGSIYIDNLLAALSVLPMSAQPHVRLLFLSSPLTPLAKRLLSHSVVQNTVSHNRLFAQMGAVVNRVSRGLTRRCPWISRLSNAPEHELLFPVFDTSQQWRKNLYWIPDFQPHFLPELFEAKELSLRLQSFNDIANAQGILLLSSDTALADFRRFYPSAMIEPRVWSFCSSIEAGSVESCRETLSRYDLPEKFLYIANQFWRHKDHATVFAALRTLQDRGIGIPLVCTGLQNDRRDSAYFAALTKELARNGLQHQVYFLGVVPREDQIQFFRAAAAVVQPSRFEGWSTVIEDAKALGRPIIASDIPVHLEQLAGVEHAHLFKVSNASDLADRIAMLWPNLLAGPAPDLEASAAKRRDKKRLDSAHRFVAIVDEAIAYPQRTQ